MSFADAPQASLQLGGNLKADEIQEGKDVYLDCKVQSNPYTDDVGWMFNGKETFCLFALFQSSLLSILFPSRARSGVQKNELDRQ